MDGHDRADSKRPRLSSWQSSAPQPPSGLPHPHGGQLPPPQPPQQQQHHHHSNSPYQLHSHRPGPAEHSSAQQQPPVPSPGAHGHALQHPDADRRRHDQDLAPMQDPYRHPPPPPHPPSSSQPPPLSPAYAAYSSRDAMKRDVDQRRLSSNHVQEPGHHSSQYAEQPRHMSYESNPPPTAGGYRYAQPQPPSTPTAVQQSFEPQPIYQAPPSDNSFYSIYPSSMPSTKKRNTRASQACDQCRQLKAKCDETKPCKSCRDKGTECRYRDPVPKATDKAQTDILEGINMMQSKLNTLANHFQGMDQRLTRMDGRLTRMEGGQPSVEAYAQPADVDMIKAETQSVPAYREQEQESAKPAMQVLDDVDDEMETEPGPVVPPGESAIHMNHTTLAGLLLEWPSIQELTKPHLDREGVRFISEYPISQEQSRGLLIPYGRGEDSHPRRHREASAQANPDAADEGSDMASPSPRTEWGRVGGPNPSDPVEYHGGALTPQGSPDFSEAKVWIYVESFKENILHMHPIVQPKQVDTWVRGFLETLPKASTSAPQPQATPAFAVDSVETAGSKRKRSPPTEDGSTAATQPHRVGPPNRTIHSALVLMILALGKVCLSRDRIPDALHNGDPNAQSTPIIRNGVPGSPGQGSPPGFLSRSLSTGAPSPVDERSSQPRRPSFNSGGARSSYSLKRNYDSVPGLEYFAVGSDILGNHIGSYNNMKAVYAFIFSGLFQGQLARPLESFAHIMQAGHKLQVIMRPSLDKMRRFKEGGFFIPDGKYNQLALAFWTCLQLESDLIAEFTLPASNLLQYEEDMPPPNMSGLEGFPQRVLDSYLGQLYLRRHLNSIHRMFYSPDDPIRVRGEDKFKNVELVSGAVQGMHWVSKNFAFREDDPPADDILAARLRAKYWGAQVITYRPFVRQILQFSHNRKHPESSNPPLTVSEFRPDIDVPRMNPEAKSGSDIDSRLLELAKRGIKALIESTRPLHGLDDRRPIITNVFGTAHAQWGNMLVLSAAYKDPILHPFVDENLLKVLFERTIAFLGQSATATGALRIDKAILEGLYRDIFPGSEGRASSHRSTNAVSAQPQDQVNGG